MKRRHLVLVLGVIAALAIAVPVVALQSGVSAPVKKAIKKEVARQVAKLKLPQGAAGRDGAPGTPGKDGADGKDALTGDEVLTNHLTINPADGTTPTTVLSLPGGFQINCYSNGTNSSFVKIENSTPGVTWAGTVTYNENGVTLQTDGISTHAGSEALFGTDIFGTAHYQFMDTTTEAAPTRIWDVTVSIIRNSAPAQVSGGPHCIAEAVSGPA
jgi:hypothetical protein